MKKMVVMALVLALCQFLSLAGADEKDAAPRENVAKDKAKTLNPPADEDEQKAEAELDQLPFETEMGATFRKMSKRKPVAAQGELGSKTNPVRCAGPAGEQEYLGRLRWKDGQPVKFERLGSVGAGIYGHILDLYKVTCADGSVHEVYMDMYYTRLVDEQPIPGFKLGDKAVEAPGPEIWLGLCKPSKDKKLYGISLSKSNGKLLGLFLEVGATNEDNPPAMKVLPMTITEEGKKLKCEVSADKVEKDEKPETFQLTITPQGKMEGDSFTVEVEIPSKGIKEKIEMARPPADAEPEDEQEGENEEGDAGQAPAIPDDPKKKELEKSAPSDEGQDAE